MSGFFKSLLVVAVIADGASNLTGTKAAVKAVATGATEVYDYENRLTAKGSLTQAYDADGNRIKKSVGGVTTFYLVDDLNPTGYAQVLAEYTDPANTPTVRYTYGHDLIAQTRGSTTQYYIYDGQGSVRVVVDNTDSATVQKTYDYDAYGNELAVPDGFLNNYRYAGEQRDDDLEMYYNRARYYQPELGRFLNQDTFEGKQQQPGSLNKYLYCTADPVNRIDPSGNFSVSETLSVQGIQRVIDTGLGTIGNIYRVYRTAQKVRDLFEYANMVSGLVAALGQPTPEAAKAALISEIQKRLGATSISELLNGFDEAFKSIGPNWEHMARAISERSGDIAQEAAARVSSRIPKYLAIQAQGRLKPVFYAPTGPGRRGNEHYIDVGSKVQIAVSPTGGRLFGFGLRTSRANVDPIFQIHYWDGPAVGGRLMVHYHLLGDDERHPSGRNRIWP